MNKMFSNILLFVGGVAVGSITTWQLVKTKYERFAQEEIDSVKEVFSKRAERIENEIKPSEVEAADHRKKASEYLQMIVDSGYAGTFEEGGEAEAVEEPEIISPDEFGEINYETVYLSYYADRVLADEVDDIVEDVENTVGSYALTRFGEYEDECIHVRNHRLRTDYEITIDNRSYYEDIKGVSAADE